jgi:hypothetical protein
MKLNIIEEDADFSVCPVRTNNGNRAKRVVLSGFNKLVSATIFGEKDVAFLESFNLNHVYKYDRISVNRKHKMIKLSFSLATP